MGLEVFKNPKSLFIRLKEGDFFGVGEYCPLKSMHSHSVDEAFFMLKSLKDSNILDLLNLRGSSFELASYFKKFDYPLSYLLSQLYFSNLCLKETSFGSIHLCGLIESTDLEESKNLTLDFYNAGYLALKVKVGKLEIKEDLKRLKAILSLTGNMKIRLDANGALSLSEALALIKMGSIEYFEEPIKNFKELQILKEKVPIAADESFSSLDELLKLSKRAQVLVLKPSRFHSLYELILIAEKAQELNIKPVLSHAYESKLSTAIFAFLAVRLELFWPQGILVGKNFLKDCNKIDLIDAQKVLLSFL